MSSRKPVVWESAFPERLQPTKRFRALRQESERSLWRWSRIVGNRGGSRSLLHLHARSWRIARRGSHTYTHGVSFYPECFNASVYMYLTSLQTSITSRSWCLRVGHYDAALINNLSLVSAISIPFCLIVFQESSRVRGASGVLLAPLLGYANMLDTRSMLYICLSV